MRAAGRFTSPGRTTTPCRVDTDAGTQTRLFRFAPAAGPAHADVAGRLDRAMGTRRRRGGPPAGGSLTVVTRNMRAGYLRKNGVPYSANATVTEYFDVVAVSGWRPDAGRHHRGRRSALSHAALHRQLALQEGSGRFQMGSHAMFSHDGDAPPLGAVCCCALASETRLRSSSSSARGRRGTPRTSRATRIRSTTSGCRSTTKGARGAHLQRIAARDDRAAVRGLAAVLLRARVRSVCGSGATRSGQGQRDLLHDRRVGRSRADDDLDGRPASAVEDTPSTRAAVSPPAGGKATRSSRARRT